MQSEYVNLLYMLETNKKSESVFVTARRWVIRNVHDRGPEEILQCYEKNGFKKASKSYPKAEGKSLF